MLYGMAKSPVSKMSYISQSTEYLMDIQPESYFYVILPNGIDHPIEMLAILKSGEHLKRPFEI